MNQSISEDNHKNFSSKPPRKKSNGTIFLLLFLTAFALLFSALGAVMIHSSYKKENTYAAASEGRIINYSRHTKHNNKRMFSPIVEYWVGNQVFTGETNTRYNYRPFSIGEKVSVYYNPQKPDDFYIKEFDLKTSYMIGGIFLFTGIGIFVILALFAVLGKAKIDKKRKEQLQVILIFSFMLLFVFIVFSCLAGPGITICIFTGMGLFTLFGLNQNKRKK